MRLLYSAILLFLFSTQSHAAGALIKQSAIATKPVPIGADRITGVDSQASNAAKNFLLSALPVSAPTQTALNLKANISGQCWPGLPTTDNQIIQSTGIGTCAWTSTIDGLINDAGSAVDDILSAAEVNIRIATRERAASTAPTLATTPCIAGEWSYDTNYEYRCVATNTWKRAQLTTW